MSRPSSLSGIAIGNTFSFLFVRFVEFSGKNRFKYVQLSCIFDYESVVARYCDVSCELIHSVCCSFGLFGVFNLVSKAN